MLPQHTLSWLLLGRQRTREHLQGEGVGKVSEVEEVGREGEKGVGKVGKEQETA